MLLNVLNSGQPFFKPCMSNKYALFGRVWNDVRATLSVNAVAINHTVKRIVAFTFEYTWGGGIQFI